MSLVERVATPIDDVALAGFLSAAHADLYGALAPHNTLAFAWAQCCQENDRGRAIYNHNWGNITCDPAKALTDYYQVTTTEYENHDPTKGRARTLSYPSFSDHTSGANRYWKLVMGRYRPAMTKAAAGDVAGAVDGMAELGYFTAPVAPYKAGIGSLVAEFHRRFPDAE